MDSLSFHLVQKSPVTSGVCFQAEKALNFAVPKGLWERITETHLSVWAGNTVPRPDCGGAYAIYLAGKGLVAHLRVARARRTTAGNAPSAVEVAGRKDTWGTHQAKHLAGVLTFDDPKISIDSFAVGSALTAPGPITDGKVFCVGDQGAVLASKIFLPLPRQCAYDCRVVPQVVQARFFCPGRGFSVTPWGAAHGPVLYFQK